MYMYVSAYMYMYQNCYDRVSLSVSCSPFHPGQAVLTYFGKWDFVEWEEKYRLLQMLYVAPGGLLALFPGSTGLVGS